MPRKYEVIDELIKDELREFLLWLETEKEMLIYVADGYDYVPVHKAPEDLINEYMEIE